MSQPKILASIVDALQSLGLFVVNVNLFRLMVIDVELTHKEKLWVERVQKALDSCPSKRIGFYTTGDCDVSMFDITKYNEICTELDKRHGGDFGPICDKLGHGCDESFIFPNQVESTAG